MRAPSNFKFNPILSYDKELIVEVLDLVSNPSYSFLIRKAGTCNSLRVYQKLLIVLDERCPQNLKIWILCSILVRTVESRM